MKDFEEEYKRLRKRESIEIRRAIKAMEGDDITEATTAFDKFKKVSLELEISLVERHNDVLSDKIDMTHRYESILRRTMHKTTDNSNEDISIPFEPKESSGQGC